MALGPIEVLVVGFPGNRFNGEILPELERLVEAETITIVDGLLLSKGEDDEIDFVEFGEDDANPEAAKLAELLDARAHRRTARLPCSCSSTPGRSRSVTPSWRRVACSLRTSGFPASWSRSS